MRQVRGGVRLEVTAAGSLPPRMPDRDTNMVITFELTGTGGGQVSVYAVGDAGGWTTYRGDGDGRQRLSGRLDLNGRSMRIAVRSSELPGSPRLDWKAETSWTRSTLTSTAYAFDTAPNHGHATYRAAGR